MPRVNQICAYFNFEGQTVAGVITHVRSSGLCDILVTSTGRGVQQLQYVKQGLRTGHFLVNFYSPVRQMHD